MNDMSEHIIHQPLKEIVAKSFGDAASSYDAFAKIQHRVAAQLLNELPAATEFLADQQGTLNILDLGCGTGYCLPVLKQKYANASITGADLSQGMLDYAKQQHPEFEYAIADAESLPFASNSFDFIFSNFAVQWCESFSEVLAQAYKTLKPNGYLLLSTLADGTLAELKQAWAQVDDAQHVNDFETPDHLEQAIDESGFHVIRISSETQFDYYDDIRGLTDSLKRIGAHNMTQGRSKTLTSPRQVKAFKQAMESHREEHGLPASYQVFTCLLRKIENV